MANTTRTEQTGHHLEKVHAQLPSMPRYFTACGKRGITTRKPEDVTCLRCIKRINLTFAQTADQTGGR